IKNEQIRSKDEIIGEKNERIREKNEIINKLNDQIKELTSKISNEIIKRCPYPKDVSGEIGDTNRIINFLKQGKLIIEQDKEIQTIKEQITTKNLQIQEIKNEIKRKDELLNTINKKIHENEEQIRLKDMEILEIKNDIKEKDELLNAKDKELQEKNYQAKRKDDQNRELTNRLKIISQNLSNANEKLSKSDETNFCPYTGSGTFHIQIPKSFKAPCNGSGWMVIQRRMDGSVDFDRTWNEYKEGFGNITGEFFIGLEKLHLLTHARPHELKILMGDIHGDTAVAHYDDFKIGNEDKLYALEVLGKFSGDAGDSLKYHKNMKFSTFDKDNDLDIDGNCGIYYAAGWWFNHCSKSSLNGNFKRNGQIKGTRGIFWSSWKKSKVSLTFVQMMIKPKDN
ncbi:hypothetical protein KR067_009867, partial [Drosophila pandora]